MFKQRKRSLRRRRQTTFLALILIIIMLTISPFVWRMDRLRRAEYSYDIQKVQEELQWWEMHGGFLNKLKMIRDVSLWYDLNIGGDNLEVKLAEYQDEKHQFWLFLLNLQNGKMKEAQNILNFMDKTLMGKLGNGLMLMAKGDVEESSQLLGDTELEWKTMPKHAQALRHLTLAQAGMIMGDHQLTQTELDSAMRLDPNNPLCLSLAFDIALEERQWTKAQELSLLIVAQTWRPKNTLFETKKALLAIHENNLQELSNSFFILAELPRGDASINYVKGVHALSKGQLQEGRSLLEQALKSGLEGGLESDAQKSLDQVIARQNAEQSLYSIVVENR